MLIKTRLNRFLIVIDNNEIRSSFDRFRAEQKSAKHYCFTRRFKSRACKTSSVFLACFHPPVCAFASCYVSRTKERTRSDEKELSRKSRNASFPRSSRARVFDTSPPTLPLYCSIIHEREPLFRLRITVDIAVVPSLPPPLPSPPRCPLYSKKKGHALYAFVSARTKGMFREYSGRNSRRRALRAKNCELNADRLFSSA